MKIYTGREIMNIIDVMDYILFNSSLRVVFDNDRHHYRELVDRFPELLDDMICYMDDNETSYMFVEKEDSCITIAMWVSIGSSIGGFRETMQYFNALRKLCKGDTVIKANCRVTTSLPIVKRLCDRYGSKMNLTYVGPECYGFSDVVVEYKGSRD